MTPDPMTEAVEAAARADVAQSSIGCTWDELPEEEKGRWISHNQAALEAAIPILRAQFAEEVAGAIEVEGNGTWLANVRYHRGREDAAAIVRNFGVAK